MNLKWFKQFSSHQTYKCQSHSSIVSDVTVEPNGKCNLIIYFCCVSKPNGFPINIFGE